MQRSIPLSIFEILSGFEIETMLSKHPQDLKLIIEWGNVCGSIKS